MNGRDKYAQITVKYYIWNEKMNIKGSSLTKRKKNQCAVARAKKRRHIATPASSNLLYNKFPPLSY